MSDLVEGARVFVSAALTEAAQPEKAAGMHAFRLGASLGFSPEEMLDSVLDAGSNLTTRRLSPRAE